MEGGILDPRLNKYITPIGSRTAVLQPINNVSFPVFQQELIMARQSSSIVSSLASSTGVASTDLPLDPFLSGLSDHQRQESADSGLGMGVPHSYSMPHTPEGFLAGMDDRMDCTSEAGANLDSTDITLADNLDSTDDLVPSLQVFLPVFLA